MTMNSLIIRHMRASAAMAIAFVLLVGVAWPQDQRRVTLMAYNVENLFDTEDNPTREGGQHLSSAFAEGHA
jgi:hypothetical protein